MLVPRAAHYLLAALIWGAPGVTITIKGVVAYSCVPLNERWWLLVATAAVVVAFFYIFGWVTRRYIARISTLPERSPIYSTFPLRGWMLLLFMMGLGIAMKYLPNVPMQFVASFYSALGPMLLLSAVRFMLAACRQ